VFWYTIRSGNYLIIRGFEAMEKMENPSGLKKDDLDILQMSFQAILGQHETLFYNIIDFFPYPIVVCDRSGTTVMVNHAMLRQFDISNKEMIIGKYNIFKDPEIEKSGLPALVREVFNGTTLTVTDIEVSVKSVREFHKTGDSNTCIIYQDVTGFPIIDKESKVFYVVILFITRRVYNGNSDIAKATEYLEVNWNRKYSLKETAKAANLSPYHFSRVFKSNTGMTPYSYYMKKKLDHLKEMLRDKGITVKEAFGACGLEYSGHYFGVFKKHVGITPKQYRNYCGKKTETGEQIEEAIKADDLTGTT
jgi:AraC family transcriptional regulator